MDSNLQIRIRDPNQGGKDVTDEILSGGRTSSTPTPPQSASGLDLQANGESAHVPVVVRPDDGSKNIQGFVKAASESPSPPPLTETELDMADVCELNMPGENTMPDLSVPLLENLSLQEVPLLETHPMQTVTLPEAHIQQAVSIVEIPTLQEVPHVESLTAQTELVQKTVTSLPQAENLPSTQPEVSVPNVSALVKDEPLELAADPVSHIQHLAHKPLSEPIPLEPEETALEPAQVDTPEPIVTSPDVHTNGLSEEVITPPIELNPPSVCQPEPTLESPIVQPEELLLTNGEGNPGHLEPETPCIQPEDHVSPIAEPEEQPLSSASNPVKNEEKEKTSSAELPTPTQAAVPSQSSESHVQVAVSAPKKKRKMKDLNKKEAVGDLLDAFKE
ncbi:eukaryotic translation initiation factor 4 gamma 1, partial [Bombina bombina]|uniref:eukaryotic translation initiation factor 4 gamma 1 n=1 Tax=Bombina bombina TaxID=8345 RepID=UPI00235A531A